MDTLEAMGTARAMRWLRSEPVPDELIERLVWAATRASSAHNVQPWDFIVVRDQDSRRAIADAIARSVADNDPMPAAETAADKLIDRGVRNLFEHMGDAPVLIFICGRDNYPHSSPNSKFMWNALGGATQNMVVAARDLELGVAPTMLHVLAQDEIREVLRIPDDVTIGTTAIVGWPDRDFGPLNRRPVEAVIHRDRW